MTNSDGDLQTTRQAESETRGIAAGIKSSSEPANRPPGLTPEDIANATPDELSRIEAVIRIFDALDGILANPDKLDAIEVFHFDGSVRPPWKASTKTLFVKMPRESDESMSGQGARLKSPAYRALWYELLARGFAPEVRLGAKGPNSCVLYARVILG